MIEATSGISLQNLKLGESTSCALDGAWRACADNTSKRAALDASIVTRTSKVVEISSIDPGSSRITLKLDPYSTKSNQGFGTSDVVDVVAKYFGDFTEISGTPRLEKKLVSFASTDREQLSRTDSLVGNPAQDAIEGLKQAQGFSAALMLMSSLVQTVLSSSKRLTQGQ
jgi:hypothetical protein